MEFLPDDIEDLREIIATGTDADTALRVLNGFLDSWRYERISTLETKPLTYEQLQVLAVELRAIKKFKDTCQNRINLGKYAVKELNKDGK